MLQWVGYSATGSKRTMSSILLLIVSREVAYQDIGIQKTFGIVCALTLGSNFLGNSFLKFLSHLSEILWSVPRCY